jgi:glycosyltransferase involved in cell wall biosynthesis
VYSIVTTCKGRLHHLRESLPAMLRQPHSEVIVVDYDCPDVTAGYVSSHHPSARVVRAGRAAGFNVSRARNIGGAAARGETLVFVDADVVLADSFMAFVAARVGEGAYAKPLEPLVPGDNSVQGTCVVHKRHFDLVGGYDEVLVNYGGEDLELYERLNTAQIGIVPLVPELFARVIPHGSEDRERFFGKRADQGFMVGKVYRVAKDMLIRLSGSFEIDLATRRGLYAEISRLVQNMGEMTNGKSLTLEINFPDTATRGLHERWSFLRTLKLTVTEKPESAGASPAGRHPG